MHLLLQCLKEFDRVWRQVFQESNRNVQHMECIQLTWLDVINELFMCGVGDIL